MSEWKITDPFHVNTTFVNDVVASGSLNGVVNLTFATALFSPGEDNKVDPDLVISSRLRMDLYCAQNLYAALGKILENPGRPTLSN